ncbi:MAG TPA: hypothetical protein VIU61_20495 [Kofleriaceae bacterium]
MKKTKRGLTLRTETVAILDTRNLVKVIGGAGQANCPTSELNDSCSDFRTKSVYCYDGTGAVC